MLRLLLALLVIGPSFSLPAQRSLSGIVIDAANGEPLSFVSVFLKNDQSHGVVTNERGEYRITLSDADLKDKLVFSLISYQTRFETIPDGEVLNLQMETAFVELDEIIVVSDLGLRNIVERAIKRIPENYGTKNYLLQAYSRTYTITDGEYSQFIDAMVTIKDKPWNDPDRRVRARASQFRLSDYRGNGREDLRVRNYGQHSLLQGYESFTTNPVRNQALHWLNIYKNNVSLMTYANRGEYTVGKDTLIKIQYSLNRDSIGMDEVRFESLKSYFTGEVLINKTDYAILRNTQGHVGKGWYRDAVYQKIGNKYYVKQLLSNSVIDFNMETQNRQLYSLLHINAVVTNPKAMKQIHKGNLLLTDAKVHEVRTPYDPQFWKEREMMLKIPAPEAMSTQLERLRSFDEQFRGNARRVKE